jgi:hypothetical protein
VLIGMPDPSHEGFVGGVIPPLPWPLLPCSAQTSKEARGRGGCGAFWKAAWVHAMLIHSRASERASCMERGMEAALSSMRGGMRRWIGGGCGYVGG